MFPFIKKIRIAFNCIYFRYVQGQNINIFGFRDPTSALLMPSHIANPRNIYMYEKTRIQSHAKIITHTGKFIMKKYSGAAPGLTVITGNHTPTVGIPHFLLALSRVNDQEKDVIVEEDVWLGANVTLLPGITIGRGGVVGACSVVTKTVPPYAVIAGNPAKIIASKFTLDEIIEHESLIYPVEERFDREFLIKLFKIHFSGYRSIGKQMTPQTRKQYTDFLKQTTDF